MDLIIGKNTYIDIDFVDENLESITGEDSDIYSAWEDLSDNQKEVYVYRSAIIIDSLSFVGKKKYKNQEMQLPRILLEEKQEGGFNSDDIPFNIKLAQLTVLSELLPCETNNNNLERLALIKSGVTSITLDKVSESYDSSKIISTGTVSDNVRLYLDKYLNGGFPLC